VGETTSHLHYKRVGSAAINMNDLSEDSAVSERVFRVAALNGQGLDSH
jgi:hypothetical protein